MLQGNKPCGFRLEKCLSLGVISLKLPHVVKTSTCLRATSTWLKRTSGFSAQITKLQKSSPPLPSSVNCHPNLRESCNACPSKAAWCINFLGMQPTFTHVPPRPERKEQNVFFTSAWLISKENQSLRVKLLYNRFAMKRNLPHEFPRGVGVTKSSTITFFSYLAASCKTN